MRDEDFNRMFATRDKKDPGAWVILICGVVAILCVAWLYALSYAHAAEPEEPGMVLPYSDEACDMNYGCRDIVWELIDYNGKVIATGLDTEEECRLVEYAIYAQTAPFVRVSCRARFVVREES